MKCNNNTSYIFSFYFVSTAAAAVVVLAALFSRFFFAMYFGVNTNSFSLLLGSLTRAPMIFFLFINNQTKLSCLSSVTGWLFRARTVYYVHTPHSRTHNVYEHIDMPTCVMCVPFRQHQRFCSCYYGGYVCFCVRLHRKYRRRRWQCYIRIERT